MTEKTKLKIEVGVDVSCYGIIDMEVDSELLKPGNGKALKQLLSEEVQKQYDSDELHFDSPEWDSSTGLRIVEVETVGTEPVSVMEDVPVNVNYYNIGAGLLLLIEDGKLPQDDVIFDLIRASGYKFI